MSDDVNNKAATVLGTIGTVLWCIQLIPQIVRNYRHKNCEGLPPLMMFLWAASGVPFGVYFIIKKANLPVQIQPHIFMLFATITWAQCLYYPPIQWPRKKLIILVSAVCVLFAGIEIALVFPLRIVYNNGTEWPTTFIGAIAAVLLAVGLIPPYFEIKQHHGEVVGINFIFLGMDSAGALFSIFSLVAQGGKMDIMGIVLYCIVVSMELGIFCCQIVWILTHRDVIKERKRLKALEAKTDIKPDPAGSVKDDEIMDVGVIQTTDKISETTIENKPIKFVLTDEENTINHSK